MAGTAPSSALLAKGKLNKFFLDITQDDKYNLYNFANSKDR